MRLQFIPDGNFDATDKNDSDFIPLPIAVFMCLNTY